MEAINTFLNDYHITTLLLIFTIIFIYFLNKKIKMNELQISILKKDLDDQYDMIELLSGENNNNDLVNENNEQTKFNVLPIELYPSDSELFKSELLKSKQSTITIYYNNGDTERKIWDAINIDHTSNIIGNLRSRPEFRNGNWQKKNIAKVKVEVINQNFPNSNNSSINHKNSNILDSTNMFYSLYKSIYIDVKAGKLKYLGTTKITISDNKILFGNNSKSQSSENINLLFDYFIRTNKTNVTKYDKDDWFSLISKLTNGRTKTIDYIYYRDFIQELLNRYYKK
ncbi:MAG: hypothetical protein RLY43_799 [Bacteroidota bacterium]